MTSLLKPLDLARLSIRHAPRPSAVHTRAPGLSLTDLRGEVLLVNFWASWCPRMSPEMPALERLHRELAPRGLAVVGINAREDMRSRSDGTPGFGPDVRARARSRRQNQRVLWGGGSSDHLSRRARRARRCARRRGTREWMSPTARAIVEALLAESAPEPRQPMSGRWLRWARGSRRRHHGCAKQRVPPAAPARLSQDRAR